MKVTLTRVNSSEQTSKKSGKKYTSVGIQTKEHGDRWVNGFGNAENETWKEGDIVEITLKENGEYLNFETIKISNQAIMDALRNIYVKLNEISKKLNLEEINTN